MNKILRYTGMIIFLVVFASATAVVPAQDTGDAFQMDNMLGPGCGLKVGKDGKIKISRDEQGDVTQIMARKSVQLVMPPDYKMDCNVLTFNKVENKMVAVGSPVKIRSQKLNADCTTFEYYPSEKKTVLSGNPVVHSNDGNNSGDMIGSRIIVTQNAGGGQDVEIESGSISSPPAPGKPASQDKDAATIKIKNTKPTATTPKKVPVKPVQIDANTIEKIPETSSGE